MENTTFQARIEEKARQRLLKDLLQASGKLHEIGYLIGHDFKSLLDVSEHYSSYESKTITRINNESSQEIFDKLLPKYVSQITDEILQKVDEIDWLLNERNQEQDY